jgi:hypothetical protein
MKNSVFWDITPCSPLEIKRRLGGTHRLHLQGRRINQARNRYEVGSKQSQTLKMEATCPSETPVDFQRTTRRYIPEESTHHLHKAFQNTYEFHNEALV